MSEMPLAIKIEKLLMRVVKLEDQNAALVEILKKIRDKNRYLEGGFLDSLEKLELEK